MEFNQNRLRFVHCEHLFNNVDEIKNYVRSVQYERASLYAEPMIFKYGNEKKPCIVLAIGSVGEGKFVYDTETGDVLNETFYIDFSQVERDIEIIYKELAENKAEIERIGNLVENVISACGLDENGNYVTDFKDKIIGEATSLYVADKMLSEYIIALEKRHELYVKDTNTVDLTTEKGETGVTLFADVKLGSKIYDGKVIENIIEKQEDGIFTSVDLDFFEEESKLVLTINGDDKKDIKLPKEAHVIKGEYDTYTESLILTLNNAIDIEGELSDTISINLAKLIDEWAVLGEASETPIVLTKEHVSAKDTVHKGIYEYQDILKADVRILDKVTKPDNILMKDSSGKYLYVDGVASNISYMRNNEKITVQQGIDEKISKTDYSKQDDSVITYREDGLYSHIDMRYDSSSNKIIFEKSDKDGVIHKFEYELNSLSLFSKAYWDATTEEVVIQYVDATNEIQEIRIPIKLVVDQLDVDNSDRTITLTLVKNDNGIDKLSADVNISLEADNILQDTHHSLYVKGTADNIKMGNKTLGETVESAINTININYQYAVSEEAKIRGEEDRKLFEQINQEIIDARRNESDLNTLIGNEINDRKDEITRIDSALDKKFAELDRTDNDLREDLLGEIELSKSERNRIEDKVDSNFESFNNAYIELSNKIEVEKDNRKDEDRTLREDLTRFNDSYNVYTSETTSSLENEIKRSIQKDDTLEKAINSSVDRLDNRDAELADEIFHLSADTSFKTIESGTLKLTKTEQNIGYTLEGEVKVSTQQYNLLNTDGEALYAYVDLSYDEAKNQLILKRSGNNVDKVIDLSVGSIIKSITYDEVTKELVILYEDASDIEHEVRVNVSELFNDWDVETNHIGAVKLTKIDNYNGNGVDKLSAEVVISSLSTNLLKNDQGSLYVSNSASEIKLENGKSVSETLSDLQDKDIKLEQSIRDEKANREIAEANIRKDFAEADSKLSEAIAAETSRANAEDEKLKQLIDINKDNISVLINDVDELRSDLDAEIVNARNAEHALEDTISNVYTALTKEVERSIRLDNEHSELISNLNSSLENEINVRKENDGALSLALNEEVTRAKGMEDTLYAYIKNNQTNLANEIATARAAEDQLRKDLAAETERANKADDEINKTISDHFSAFTQADADLTASIATEKGRAETAEAQLGKDIAALQVAVDSNSTKLDDVITNVEEVVKTYAMSVEDSVTVDLTKKAIDAGGFVVSADVNISKTNGNIIKTEGDGLYSFIDLKYTVNNNTLTFIKNDEIVNIPLNSVSTIESIIYDSKTDEIVITYVTNVSEKQEVRFSANKLFKPIKVDNNGHNVILTINDGDSYVLSADADLKNSIDNTDKSVKLSVNEDGKLTAQVNVSTLEDNILTVDNNYNLYVKGDCIKTTADKVDMINNQYGDTVEISIDTLGDMIDELEQKFENYYDEDLINSMNKDIINLKSKTNINPIDTPSIDLTFVSTENSSSLKANLILSDDPHNLLKVTSDTFGEFANGTSHPADGTGNFTDDTYNGVLFDGNIDYLTFNTKDVANNIGHYENWTRHIQLKRDEKPFETKALALEYLYNADFLNDKKDGEPVVARYLSGNKVNLLYGIVSVNEQGVKSINTLDSLGTVIDRIEYHADSTVITTTDEFGINTVTQVTPESLYVEYTDASSLKHTIVVPLKDLIEEYVYPTQIDKFDGNTNTVSDGKSVKEHHNVKFDVERHEDGKSIIKADLEYFDCGEYE